jgi:hypothetical protein
MIDVDAPDRGGVGIGIVREGVGSVATCADDQ